MKFTEITAIAWVLFLLAILFLIASLALNVGMDLIDKYLDLINGLGMM